MSPVFGPGDSERLLTLDTAVQPGASVMLANTGESGKAFELLIRARSLASGGEVSEHGFVMTPNQARVLMVQIGERLRHVE